MTPELYAYINKCCLCGQFGQGDNLIVFLPDGEGVFPICERCLDSVKQEIKEDSQ